MFIFSVKLLKLRGLVVKKMEPMSTGVLILYVSGCFLSFNKLCFHSLLFMMSSLLLTFTSSKIALQTIIAK